MRWTPLADAGTGRVGFTRLDGATTGILFTNLLREERGITNRNLLSGSGVALGDADGDGRCDLYLCGLDQANGLYRNLGGWRFEDITARAGVGCEGQDSTAAVWADVDGDGDLDLLVNSLGRGLRLFTNDGTARFVETTATAGVGSTAGGMSVALADVEGDGDLDLYGVNYRTTTVMDQPKTTFQVTLVDGRPWVTSVNGVPATAPQHTNRFVFAGEGDVLELGEPDDLYLNDGKGRFTRVSFTGGAFRDERGQPLREPPRDWGLSVQARDWTGDGAPDLYVCNDLFSPDRVWINDGRGGFQAADPLALRTTSTFSMGIDFGDLDRDGHDDFMIVDMLGTSHRDRHTQVSTQKPIAWPIGMLDNRPQVWRNTLHWNRGDGTFAEIGFYAGVEASNWSWMPLFLDVDLDGLEDILIPNGQMRDFQNVDMANHIEQMRAARPLTADDILALARLFPDFSTPSLAFRNRGDLTFVETGAAWGWDAVGVSQGTAAADLDGDGDLDVVVNKLNAPAGIFRNDTPAPRVAVSLVGPAGNPSGVGARLTVSGGPRPQSQEVICGGHYLSGSDPLRTFAAGTPEAQLEIRVTWRDGRQTVVREARPGRRYVIEAAHATAAAAFGPDRGASPPAPWFEDVTDRLGHRHHEDPFDDFESQPLLPRRLSQLGPGVAWHDVDQDGWEDLVIASGRGGPLAVYQNDQQGGFQRRPDPVLHRPAARDQTTVLGLGSTLLVGAANYEDGQTNGGCLRVFDLSRQTSGDSVLGQSMSAGPLALGDVDGDGVLELFVGGRVLPRRYPEPARSLLLRYHQGRFGVAQSFDGLGLVSGAVFSDLDGDGRPDLALACEWGPVRLFRNENGRLVAWDPIVQWRTSGQPGLDEAVAGPNPTRFSALTGWWNGIAAGDLDGDGRLDLIASNWGLNHPQKRHTSRDQPRRLYYGDLDGSGAVQLIEGYFNRELNQEVPARGYLAVTAALPFVQERAPTFSAYGTANLQALYGERLAQTRSLEAGLFTTTLFLNRGDSWEVLPLPREAQFAPAFGVAIGDLDGDGYEDVFLSQNFFATPLDAPRQDAGRGLWLRGDGRGGLTPLRGTESGVKVYGEQRGCAVADYDQDGRLDLVVTQNGNATRLFRNARAQPGRRVRVLGPASNPAGVGTVLRLGDGKRWGPAREIHAGAGYWSTDGAVQVLTFTGPGRQLWVRRPHQAPQVLPVPAEAGELQITEAGEVRLRPLAAPAPRTGHRE